MDGVIFSGFDQGALDSIPAVEITKEPVEKTEVPGEGKDFEVEERDDGDS